MIEDTLKERGESYGEFTNNAKIAQELKDSVRGGVSWFEMAPDMKEAVHMILSKISRMVSGDPFHIDSWEDIQGYAKLVADRLNEARPESNEDDLPTKPLAYEEWRELGFTLSELYQQYLDSFPKEAKVQRVATDEPQ